MSYVKPEKALYRKHTKLVPIHETSPGSEASLHVVSVREKNLVFKRAFDIIASAFIIIFILSWLLPILALLIKLDSRGPVFFVQKRIGAMGKAFYCFKLRTMVVNEQANVQQAQVNDPRITAVGRFLRLSCFDELPQFINVLVGDMSIVGPRPHMISDCREFAKFVRHYNTRNLVKPGITGMAQVKGYRGKTNDFYDVVHRYKWDMFYVKNRSFYLDMRIMGLTIASTITAIISVCLPSREKSSQPAYQLDTPEFLN